MIGLSDSDEAVRTAAVEALGRVGDASIVPALMKALSDRDEYVRKAAEDALGKLGDSSQSSTPFGYCPSCGEALSLPKTPTFCPYCGETLTNES